MRFWRSSSSWSLYGAAVPLSVFLLLLVSSPVLKLETRLGSLSSFVPSFLLKESLKVCALDRCVRWLCRGRSPVSAWSQLIDS